MNAFESFANKFPSKRFVNTNDLYFDYPISLAGEFLNYEL